MQNAAFFERKGPERKPWPRGKPLNHKKQFGDRKGATKKLCDKDFAERSGELSGAICLKTLVLLGNDLATPSNCSEDSLVLFVRFFGFVGPFWLLCWI